MQSLITKKRLHESTNALGSNQNSTAKKLKRTSSVSQVAFMGCEYDNGASPESDSVAQALILLKTSIDKNDSAMKQWFRRCDQENNIVAVKRTGSTSDSSMSVSSMVSSRSNSDQDLYYGEDDRSIQGSTQSTQMKICIQQTLKANQLPKPSNPDEFLRCLLSLKGLSNLRYKSAASLQKVGYFPSITDEFVRGYTMEIVTAVRNDDVPALRTIHAAYPTRSFLCGSKFGDSILHLACRRSCVKVVEYLLCECNVSPQIICDYGRTPLHDALWCVKPNERIISLLLLECPHLLFVTDHRGSTPLSYAPRDTWKQLCRFLAQHIKRHGTFLKEIEINHNLPHIVPADDNHTSSLIMGQ